VAQFYANPSNFILQSFLGPDK